MYITIVLLPFMGAILSGLFGRALGVKGVHIINVSCLLITTLLAFIAYYEVVLCNSPVSIELFSWINSEHLQISWGFYFDQLTVNMLIPVLIVSLLVHVYSIGYMGEDPHQQRFFSYISLFTGLMLVLVTGNNFLVMFLGWEGVGVCSYLLVHFWYTRVAAVKSALNAMFTNRVGDYFLTLGFFAIFYTFGTLDYATVFSIAPYINTNVITFISILLLLGAAAKSAQIGLHQWLPMAMEGPTPVSSLIHAATMVTSAGCLKIIQIILYIFREMLRLFNCLFQFHNILLWKNCKSLIYNINLLNINGVKINQQDKKMINSPETGLEIAFMFNNYLKLNDNNFYIIKDSFLEWFIGFTEGDGSFIVSKDKVYFDITQNINDIQVLYFIQRELGFGKVLLRTESHRRVGVFYVTSRVDFLKLIHIFNGNLCSNYRNEQFKLWLTTFNKQYGEDIKWINRKVQPSLFTGWLSGFIDAEGHLGGRVKYCRTSKLKKAPHLSLTISQKELYILSLIGEVFNYKDKGISFDKSWNGWRLQISSIKTFNILISYLKVFTLKTKKNCFCKI